MGNIDLYDRYIKGQLSDAERSEFDARLKNDKVFESEFQLYLITVDGICKEAHQDDIDFGHALKNISREQLREIIGPRHTLGAHVTKTAKPGIFHRWIWNAVGYAAMIAIAFGVGIYQHRQSNFAVDNAIISCQYEILSSRSVHAPFEINALSDEDLKAKLPQLKSIYEESIDADTENENGFTLAMAYLRLHDREQAKAILEELIKKYGGKEDYAGYVQNYERILTLIK